MRLRNIDEIDFDNELLRDVDLYLFEITRKNAERGQRKERVIAIDRVEAIGNFQKKYEIPLENDEIEKVFIIEQKKKIGTFKDTYCLEVYAELKTKTELEDVLLYYRDNYGKRIELFETINNTLKSHMINKKEAALEKMVIKEASETYKRGSSHEW